MDEPSRAEGLERKIAQLEAEIGELYRELSKEKKNGPLWQPVSDLPRSRENGKVHGMDLAFPPEEVVRYCRQMLLPQIAVEGQKRLRTSSAVVVGAGGLGCPAAMYLAAAGIGKLGIVDCGDVVEMSNLHRQIAHTDRGTGTDKALSLAMAVKRLNPHVAVSTCSAGMSSTSAIDILKPFDIVLDCTDNVLSRYIINDACAILRRPLVSGSAIGFDGQLTVYGHGEDAPCYRCVFPSPPPAACVSSCDTAGVLGPVPGVIGVLQSMEALKLACHVKGAEVLSKRLLLFDGLRSEMRTVRLRSRNPQCPACGEPNDTATAVRDPAKYDYAAFAGESSCAIPGVESNERLSPNLLESVRSGGTALLLDVRPREQFAMCALEGFNNIPYTELDRRISEVKELSAGRPVVVVCRRGNDSRLAVDLLQRSGLLSACDVRGGLVAWSRDVNSSFPEY